MSSTPPSGVLRLYRELWRLAAGARWMLAGAMGLLIAAQLVLLSVPWFSGRAINALQLRGEPALRDAALWLGMILLATAGSWLLHGPGRLLERNVALRVRQVVADSLIDRLFALPLSWHEANHTGATAHRVQQSSHAISGFAQTQFIYLNSVVRLVGPVVALWLIAPAIGAAALSGFAVITVSIVGFDRALIRLARAENDAERAYASTLIDALGNATSLHALRQARGLKSLLARRLLAIFVPLRRSIVLNEAKWCTVDLSSRFLACSLVALFAWMATRGAPGARGALMLGSVYMVWEYAQQAGGVISGIAQHFQTFARQSADYESAAAIREAEPGPAPRDPAPCATWNRLQLRDLAFRHASSRAAGRTLEQVALTLERGRRYALIGASGSGKSTLLRVLAGLYTADHVVLYTDAYPVVASPVEAATLLRATATLVPQDAEVLAGTVGENLALSESLHGAPSEALLLEALALSRASEFLEPSPAGLALEIAERAANWSGGQRSRLALARGILAARGSSLVLFDEPTAHLDPRTESAVYDNLFAAFGEACVVSSVHRTHLVGRFDEVLVMKEGRLVAQGHPDLLNLSSPEFRQLMQAPGSAPESGQERERDPAAPPESRFAEFG